MSFPWVVVMLIGGLIAWWSLGKLGLLPTEQAA